MFVVLSPEVAANHPGKRQAWPWVRSGGGRWGQPLAAIGQVGPRRNQGGFGKDGGEGGEGGVGASEAGSRLSSQIKEYKKKQLLMALLAIGSTLRIDPNECHYPLLAAPHHRTPRLLFKTPRTSSAHPVTHPDWAAPRGKPPPPNRAVSRHFPKKILGGGMVPPARPGEGPC